MNNHGLLSLSNQPQWHYIKNGSKTYVNSLKNRLRAEIRLNTEVNRVEYAKNNVRVTTSNDEQVFDYVFFSNHPNEILNISKSLSDKQAMILKDIKYSINEVVLHKDSSVMPKNAKCWASWVYKKLDNDKPILSYWMNSLQNIDKKYPIFVSLNAGGQINKSKVFNTHILEHPIFDIAARKAQELIPSIQGVNNLFFCGAYNKYGFHEDGVVSSIKAVEKLKSIDV
jgi:predicted NAD/FAD-binding protein